MKDKGVGTSWWNQPFWLKPSDAQITFTCIQRIISCLQQMRYAPIELPNGHPNAVPGRWTYLRMRAGSACPRKHANGAYLRRRRWHEDLSPTRHCPGGFRSSWWIMILLQQYHDVHMAWWCQIIVNRHDMRLGVSKLWWWEVGNKIAGSNRKRRTDPLI